MSINRKKKPDARRVRLFCMLPQTRPRETGVR